MAAAGTERVRAVYEALAAGDPGPLSDLMDPDIEWAEPEGAPVIAGLVRGRAAVFTEVFARIPEVWAEFSCEPREFLDAGERVVVTGVLRVQGFGTGRRADVPLRSRLRRCAAGAPSPGAATRTPRCGRPSRSSR